MREMSDVLFPLSLCLSLQLTVTTPADELAYYSYDGEKVFVATITEKSLTRSPVWSHGDANPPLSARKAMRLAEGVRSMLVENNSKRSWHLVSVALVPDDPEEAKTPGDLANTRRWFWLLTYECFLDGWTGPPDMLQIPVLMDGVVVTPRLITSAAPGQFRGQFGRAKEASERNRASKPRPSRAPRGATRGGVQDSKPP